MISVMPSEQQVQDISGKFFMKARYCFILLFAWISVSLNSQTIFTVKEAKFSSMSYDEYAPVFFGDGIIFAANKRMDMLKKIDGDKGKPPFNLFYVRKTGEDQWSRIELLSEDLRSITYDGPATVNAEGNKIYFNRNYIPGDRKARTNKVGIFTADLVDGRWTNIMPFIHNNSAYNLFHPAMSHDGSKFVFASDMPGGNGGFDLYICTSNNGVWSNPVNLGLDVNTSGHEIYPVFQPNGRLYFSTNRLPGVGGYDIFYTELVDGKWVKPVNLAEPLNSRRNDAGFISNEDFTHGFITSNRNRRTNTIYEFKVETPTFDSCKEQQFNNYCFTFFEVGTIDIDTTSYMYEWRIGQDVKIRAKEANYCFAGPGEYIIQLNVIDLLTGEIMFNQASYDLTIQDIEQAYITCPDTVIVNQVITLDGSRTNLKNFDAGRFYWDLGDFTYVSGADLSHSYYKPGIYTIRLGVTNDTQKPEELKKACSLRKIVVLSD
jgi:hypothetical protein